MSRDYDEYRRKTKDQGQQNKRNYLDRWPNNRYDDYVQLDSKALSWEKEDKLTNI